MGEHLDGNDMAGALSEIFAVDVSSATAPCPSCRRVNVVAELRVYGGPQAPGLVARCCGCDEVVLRLVCWPNDTWLDLRGTLRIPQGSG